jgi:hypothetical protein
MNANLLRRSIRSIPGCAGYIAAFAVLFSTAAPSHATPITLAFDAVVGPPRQGTNDFVPPDWGFSLHQGDMVSGTFTFDPIDVPSNVHQAPSVEQFEFTIHIKSRTLATSQYSIDVADNSNPIDSGGPFDSILFGCSLLGGGTVCAPSAVPSTEPLQWAAIIALYGRPSILDGADIPAAANSWQQLALDNTMLVSMNDQTNFRFYGFSATIESFRAVPEPSALSLASIAIVPACVTARRRTRRKKSRAKCVILATGLVFVTANTSIGTPITLAFDAIVGRPRQGFDGLVPPSWNISLQQGDQVTGKFTFEPFDAPQSALQTNIVESFEFSLNIKSQLLLSSQFGIDVQNDVHASDVEPYDSIGLGCAFGGDGVACNPSTVPDNDTSFWASKMNLFGATSTLDGPDIPADVQGWQQLLPSPMIMTIIDTSTQRSYGFIATVESFRAVPEPSPVVLYLTGATLTLLVRRAFAVRNFDNSTGGKHDLPSPP